jgi:hypothetical protein
VPTHDPIRKLKEERQRRLGELLRSLESDAAARSQPPQQLKEKLDLIDYALGELRSGWRARVMPVAIAALVIGLVVSALSLWPVRTVPFTLELKTNAISIVAAADGVVEDLVLKPPLRVVGFEHIESPLLKNLGEQPRAAVVHADHARLTSATLPAGASLELEARADLLTVTVQGVSGQLSDQLEVSGVSAVMSGASVAGARALLIAGNFATPETVIFRAAAGNAAPKGVPGSLTVYSSGAVGQSEITAIAPRSLRFLQRRAALATQNPFVSSIVSGELRVVATGARYLLGPEDVLEIDGVNAERLEIAISDLLTVHAAGSARELQLRTGPFNRSLAPSVLEFAASNHRLALIWSGAVFLWGLLWSAGRLMAARRS